MDNGYVVIARLLFPKAHVPSRMIASEAATMDFVSMPAYNEGRRSIILKTKGEVDSQITSAQSPCLEWKCRK